MLFAAGMGIGLVFFGMTEPLMHFTDPRPDVAAANPTQAEAAQSALATTFLHWGLQPWAIYAVVGVAVALAIHRRGRPLALRWAFEPLIGERRVRGGWGHLIDNIALIGTVFGVATSLGLGVTQMSAGLRALGIVPEDSPWLEYAMIGAVTCVVLYTVVSGVERGMKWLSNTNLILAAGLLLLGVLGAAWVQPQGWGRWMQAPSAEQAQAHGEPIVVTAMAALPMTDRQSAVAAHAAQPDAGAAVLAGGASALAPMAAENTTTSSPTTCTQQKALSSNQVSAACSSAF